MLKKINNPEKVHLYDSVTLVYHVPEDNGNGLPEMRCRHYVIDEYGSPVEEPETLTQVETWLFNHHGEADGCMVIMEYGLSGRIFRYGNHGGFWEEVGETCGYA